jgi:hypothetical protein
MKRFIVSLFVWICCTQIQAQSLGTGSFSGVAYTKIPSGYRFPKHNGSIGANVPSIIYSPNRSYFLIYHETAGINEAGRLVLYKAGNNQIIWRSAAAGAGACVMQSDGNLVLYRNSVQRDANPSWASNTHGNDGAFLALQNDGNLVIYNANNTRALWATGTNGR